MNRRDFVQKVVGSAIVSGINPFAAANTKSVNDHRTPAISLLLDPTAGSAGKIALEKVRISLTERHVPFEEIKVVEAALGHTILVAGVTKGSAMMSGLARELRFELPEQAESLLVKRAQLNGKTILLVCGADPIGLAYALYDVADRVAWPASGASPFDAVPDVLEAPAVRDRSLSTYCMQQAYFEKRLYDEAYWAKYLDNMVRNRFNNFSLLFAYESSGYLAPPYAWFFDLPEFPEIKAVGVTKTQQNSYLSALNRVVTMTHERGLKFTLGIWDHIYDGKSSYYTEGVWDHLPKVNGRRPRWPVEGLTDKNLVAYTPRALEHFLELVPNIDTIQFRMHGESGLNKAGLRNFWVPIFDVMARQKPAIGFDARSKEFPHDLIETALQMGVHLRLTTKYLAEQVGPPFHDMHPQRFDQFQSRFSYFDLLSYPQQYKIQWRHWTSGTMRILLWGDLEYARRFMETTHLYDGDGYEVAEPLATKMASKPHDEPPLTLMNAKYRYYDEEFQRYWPFFFAFGRIGYNPDTPVEVWQRQFELHYGKQAAPYVDRGLQAASRILPRIIGYSLPLSKFPTTRGWPERQRWEDLPEYTLAEPSDIQLYGSFQEEARLRITGALCTKIRPQQTGEWFDLRAKEVLGYVAEAELRSGTKPSSEFISTMVDLKILAHLAEYHSCRIKAGIRYALFLQSQELTTLGAAIASERAALEAWEAIVQSAGDVYANDLAMGLQIEAHDGKEPGDLSGHWRDELPLLRLGIEKLEKTRTDFKPEYRQLAGKYVFDAASVETGYQLLPHTKDFSLDLPNGFYELQCDVQDDPARPQDWGPMWIEADGADRTDTFIAKSGSPVNRTLYSEVRDGKLHVMIGQDSMGTSTISRLTVTCVDPHIAHVPVRKLAPGEDAVLHATVVAEGRIRSVQVYWEDLSGRYSVREMKGTGPFRYELTIPATECGPTGRYFLLASDDKDRISIYPRGGREEPITIKVQELSEPPALKHERIRSALPMQPLRVVATARAASGLEWVRLRYRSVNQHQDYFTMEMLPTGKPNEYEAEVLGQHIPAQWDFMYFFEVMDKQGTGRIYPDAEKETPYVVVKLDRRG